MGLRYLAKVIFANSCTIQQLSLLMADSDVVRSGKVRGTTVPVEYELSRLVSNISNPHKSWTTHNTVEKWQGVIFDNEINAVHSIRWGRDPKTNPFYFTPEYCGSILWEYLSEGLVLFDVAFNALEGHVPLAKLPSTLQRMYVQVNKHIGPIDLQNLPCFLTELNLSFNDFSGSVAFNRLPQSLEILLLHSNSFHGSLDLTHLPPSLRFLNLEDNCFEGDVDLSLLNDKLDLRLPRNKDLRAHGLRCQPQ